MHWYAVEVTTFPRAVEAVEYGLMEAGALGAEERGPAPDGHVPVWGYFEREPEIERVRAALHEALNIYGLPTPSVAGLGLHVVEGRDWLDEWKKNWRPVETGRFVVAPPWSEVMSAPGRIVVRIEPGMAFGTGTHETTRLCLAAVEKHFRGGSLLDVGTGTGVLAIAAALLHPEASVSACDTDPLAVTIAHENAMLNGVAERVNFCVGTVTDQTASADLVCANLTADVILQLLPALVSATCGRLVLSGILREQAPAVAARLAALGLPEHETTSDGDWVAITV